MRTNSSTNVTARRRLTWWRKAAFALVTVCAFFLLLELVLAALGVKPASQTRDPFVGFDGSSPLFVRQGDEYVTSELKSRFFNQQRFSAVKGSNTFRIFCLGGSTTFGHPYDYRTSYPEWLKARLEEVATQRNWEVINCGGISYASYRLARLTEELVNYEPDLFIVYTGHNEFLEERTYGAVRDRNPLLTSAIRVASHSRTFNLIVSLADRTQTPEGPKTQLNGEVDTVFERSNGPEAYRRDAELQASVLDRYRFSLERIVRLAREHDAEVILVQPASNLKDFSPFKSEYAIDDTDERSRCDSLLESGTKQLADGDAEGAVASLQGAEAIDDRHALLLFTFGQALFESGHTDEALTCFLRARDQDVCPLRATSQMQQIVAEVGRQEGVEVIGLPAMLADQCRQRNGHEAVGADVFLDHVHPRLLVHAELGRVLCERMAEMGFVDGPSDRPGLSKQIEYKVLGQLTSYDNAKSLDTLAMTLSSCGKYEEARRLSEEALRLLSDDAPLSFRVHLHLQLERYLEQLGDQEAARQQHEAAVALDPELKTAPQAADDSVP